MSNPLSVSNSRISEWIHQIWVNTMFGKSYSNQLPCGAIQGCEMTSSLLFSGTAELFPQKHTSFTHTHSALYTSLWTHNSEELLFCIHVARNSDRQKRSETNLSKVSKAHFLRDWRVNKLKLGKLCPELYLCWSWLLRVLYIPIFLNFLFSFKSFAFISIYINLDSRVDLLLKISFISLSWVKWVWGVFVLAKKYRICIAVQTQHFVKTADSQSCRKPCLNKRNAPVPSNAICFFQVCYVYL